MKFNYVQTDAEYYRCYCCKANSAFEHVVVGVDVDYGTDVYQAGGDRSVIGDVCYVKRNFDGFINLSFTTTMADGSDGRTIELRDFMYTKYWEYLVLEGDIVSFSAPADQSISAITMGWSAESDDADANFMDITDVTFTDNI